MSKINLFGWLENLSSKSIYGRRVVKEINQVFGHYEFVKRGVKKLPKKAVQNPLFSGLFRE
jgi:hypothetical protein